MTHPSAPARTGISRPQSRKEGFRLQHSTLLSSLPGLRANAADLAVAYRLIAQFQLDDSTSRYLVPARPPKDEAKPCLLTTLSVAL